MLPRSLEGRLRLGPVAWMDYSAAWRPSVSEYGGQASNLHLRDGWSQSLRSSLGARLGVTLLPRTQAGNTVTADVLATWNHEYLGDYGMRSWPAATWGMASAWMGVGAS